MTSKPNNQKKIIEFLCRHIVVIWVYYQLKGDKSTQKEYFFTCVGTIIFLDNQVAVMIAGHAADEIKKLKNSDLYNVSRCGLADSFGEEAIDDHYVPLDFELNRIFSFDDLGVDFGFVQLTNHQARLVARNGVKATDEKQWRNDPPTHFNKFLIVGIPNELVVEDNQAGLISYSPQAVPLTEGHIEKESSEGRLYPRFVGTLPSDIGINSFVGMSGGPIFAFSEQQTDRYWLIGIQSRWLKSERKIFATPLKVIGGLLDSWLT